MKSEVIDRANEAVFYFQFPTRFAVDYVVKNANTDFKTAKQALLDVMTAYKSKS